MRKNSNQIEIIFKKIQTETETISYSEIIQHLGILSVANNGTIECENYPEYAHYEEYFLWNILCFCLEKEFITIEIPRIRLTLSADSNFPFCIEIILKQKYFKTLNLISLRRSLPLDFWKLCAHFSVQNGQIQWKHSIVLSPQNKAACNYHRLKALGKLAENQDPKPLQLRQLYLWNQELTHLPKEIGALKKIERLEIWNNPIQEIPDSFQQLTQLQNIILSKDQQHLVESIQRYLPKTNIGWV